MAKKKMTVKLKSRDVELKINSYDIELKSTSELNNYITSQKNYMPIGVSMINAPTMWNNGFTGKDIKIAVIDSGYAPHPDLDCNIIGGKNFTSEDGGNPDIYTDYNGHSTHCCGIIAGNGKIKGVAPNAKLLILKVLDKNGSGNAQSLLDAINYAISQKVDVISMSLGMPYDVSEIHNAIKKAVKNNILIVCASGNEGDGSGSTNEHSFPAGYNEVISVGAVDNTRLSATFSNSNKEVDLVAPGVNIVSTYLDKGYLSSSGTSMACPHITGALALLIEWSNKEFGRQLTEAEIYAQLIKRTIELKSIDRTLQGNGMLFL